MKEKAKRYLIECSVLLVVFHSLILPLIWFVGLPVVPYLIGATVMGGTTAVYYARKLNKEES